MKRKKEKRPSFILELPLAVPSEQEDRLNKQFEIGRILYNDTLKDMEGRRRAMMQTKAYRNVMGQIAQNAKDKKPKAESKHLWKQIDQMRKAYGLTKSGIEKALNKHRYHFKGLIDSVTGQALAKRLWQAYKKVFYSNGKEVRFHKFGQLNSLEGKSNKSGIRFLNEAVVWADHHYPSIVKTSYERLALMNEICYNRIVRRQVRGKYKYYVQIVLRGAPPQKHKHELGTGKVGIDIGVSTVAVVSDTKVMLKELASKVKACERRIWLLQRKIDRSRRAMNPDNYNSDGTVKKGKSKGVGNGRGKEKLTWVKSNRYLKLEAELREVRRKQAAIRKYRHHCLANALVELGDRFFIENMNFKALQKRAKADTDKKNTATEEQPKAKNRCRKRFGASLQRRAPAAFVSILSQKVKARGGTITKVNTTRLKASQYDHVTDTYTKKPLKQRWTDVGGVKVQRDLYSALLIQNVNDDLSTVDREACDRAFASFKELHDQEIERLSYRKNPSCMGI